MGFFAILREAFTTRNRSLSEREAPVVSGDNMSFNDMLATFSEESSQIDVAPVFGSEPSSTASNTPETLSRSSSEIESLADGSVDSEVESDEPLTKQKPPVPRIPKPKKFKSHPSKIYTLTGEEEALLSIRHFLLEKYDDQNVPAKHKKIIEKHFSDLFRRMPLNQLVKLAECSRPIERFCRESESLQSVWKEKIKNLGEQIPDQTKLFDYRKLPKQFQEYSLYDKFLISEAYARNKKDIHVDICLFDLLRSHVLYREYISKCGIDDTSSKAYCDRILHLAHFRSGFLKPQFDHLFDLLKASKSQNPPQNEDYLFNILLRGEEAIKVNPLLGNLLLAVAFEALACEFDRWRGKAMDERDKAAKDTSLSFSCFLRYEERYQDLLEKKRACLILCYEHFYCAWHLSLLGINFEGFQDLFENIWTSCVQDDSTWESIEERLDEQYLTPKHIGRTQVSGAKQRGTGDAVLIWQSYKNS